MNISAINIVRIFFVEFSMHGLQFGRIFIEPGEGKVNNNKGIEIEFTGGVACTKC